ncbi:MAG: Asp-tRNA(Asn)/Glu-tRNA(Gln) amidotransferase subunit GatB [Anaerolineae bacterium]|nr:Asp-tRNA(Asn)/Glu-tRNA(Gln) amidotransferase subunit GatB [Anaerolineae bacterium]
MEYEAVIGLEVHAQVHTRSKMFCACPVVPDTGNLPPNTYVCPVCLALPGALPVVNRQAVALGIRAALALHCAVQPLSVFARKSYFYPDLPKGYQITQYAHPLARNGYLEVDVSQRFCRIGITRIHLEEDTGKLYHGNDGTRVDFNRAGVPLLEIVSEPDMRSPDEARAYAMALRDVLVYLGLNTGDMEKGMIRFEANVSIRPQGSGTLGTRTEIKNLNSFRALSRAVDAEIARQIAILNSGGQVTLKTLGWDAAGEQLFVQRNKEQAHDYRYFPDPDIPPLAVTPEWVASIAASLPELPRARKARWVAHYGLREEDAALLVPDRALAGYFEAAVKHGLGCGVAPQDVANWMTGEVFRLLKARTSGITGARVSPERLAALLRLLYVEDAINVASAKKILEVMFETGESPERVVERLGLSQISDPALLEAVATRVIRDSPTQVAQYLDGKEPLIGWFVGQIMRETRGKAEPGQAQEIARVFLERERSNRF